MELISLFKSTEKFQANISLVNTLLFVSGITIQYLLYD